MPESLRGAFGRIRRALWPALIGALLSMGLLLPVLRSLSMDSTGTAIAACLLTACLCVGLGAGKRARWGAVLAGVAMLLIYLGPGGGMARVIGMLSAAIHLTSGNAEPLRVYGEEVAIIAGALLSLGGWAMGRQEAGFYPALSLVMVSMLVIWFSGGRDVLWLTAPALVALCALFARSVHETTPYGRILGASALAVLLALGIQPMARIASPAMEDFAERLRTFITDTLFFTEPRTVYSIQVDGFKPLDTRLGGPVNIEEHPVMTVETDQPLLLRGVVMNFYTGLSWMDAMPSRRYLYVDPRHRATRANTMDEDRPPQALRDADLFTPMPIRITMQADSASTLFVPSRLFELSTPMALVPYFNASSEVFITRDLAAGDTYSLSAPVINANDPRLPRALEQAAALGENRDMSDYLALHEYIAEDIWALTERVVAGRASALDKALAIRDHLRASYAYSLTPEAPPGNQDFVSFFLLRGKEGYCTYFASAMAIMARIAGLPSRYVEGYLAQPAGGVALVTSKKAHAWAEVYFDGFGWIAFDATPPSGLGGRGNSDSPQPEPDSQENTEEPDDQSGGPTEEPSPSPGPGGADEGLPEAQGEDPPPEREDTDDAPDDAPTPTREPESDPPYSRENTAVEDREDKQNKSAWWIWLLLLLLMGAIVWRGLWVRPGAIAARRCKNDDERLLLWYRCLLGILAASGLGARVCESPVQHAQRVEEAVPKESGILAVADAITQLGYGRYGASPSQVEECAKCYGAVLRRAPVKARGMWLFTRMVKGIGSLRQVP